MRLGPVALRFEHTAALAVALLVGAAVLFFSGDTDPLFAIEAGLGAGVVGYLAAYLRSRGVFGHRRHPTSPR